MIKFEKYSASEQVLRQFAGIFATAFAVVAAWVYWRNGTLQIWALTLFVILLVLGAVMPKRLAAFYSLWMNFGHGLGWVNTRLILILMFYGIFTPVGLFFRILGKRGLQLTTLPKTKTYAIPSVRRASNHFDRIF